MFARIRSHLTYANVMATIAMFIALGGSSYAAIRITSKNVPKDALTGADIKNLTGADVKNNSLTDADIKNLKTGDISNGSLLMEDFAAGQFPFLTQSQADGRYLTSGAADGKYLTPASGDSRYLTPAAGDSKYLTQSSGDSRYMADSGTIRLNAAPMMWENTNATFAGSRLPGIGETTFGNTTGATSASPVIEPTLPTVLLDKPLSLVGVNLCYATTTGSTLDYVNINTTTNTAGIANGGAPLVQDPTDRTDDACRDYTLSTPHALSPSEDVSIELNVDYTASSQSFSAGRASFIFQR